MSYLEPLIGIYSPAQGSGKSTLATALIEQFGFRLSKMAGPLKDMIRSYLRGQGCPDAEIERYVEGDLKEEPCLYLHGATPRHAMQTLGTEWGRNCMGENFWVSSFLGRINFLRMDGFAIVCDDVRFPNEAQAIRDAGGFLVHLERPSISADTSHASEGSLKDYPFDLYIVNQYTSAKSFTEKWTREIVSQAHLADAMRVPIQR